jgi:hypothetical protein
LLKRNDGRWFAIVGIANDSAKVIYGNPIPIEFAPALALLEKLP